ncbi:putative repeat protein (TIGR02543 family), partial [Ruminiclostridium sufflavum DSM 19573]
TLTGVPANFFTVAGAAATNTAGSGIVTAVFPLTSAATYTISFDENGGSTVEDINNVAYNSKIAAPTPPTKSGYQFEAWYKETKLIYMWDFEKDVVTADMTLYAKWTEEGGNSNGTASNVINDTSGTQERDVDIFINGKIQSDEMADVKKETVKDETICTVKVDDLKLNEALEREGKKSKVTVLINNNSDSKVVELNGETIKNMEEEGATIEIRTDGAAYIVPAGQININKVYEDMGSQKELKDIKVKLTMRKSPQDVKNMLEYTAKEKKYEIMTKPMEFSVVCHDGSKVINVLAFDSYVERILKLPEDAGPDRITTAIMLHSDGTVSHIPTVITEINGKYYAKINSIINGDFSLIWNKIEFSDVENHWSKEAVNDMGSRLVINGAGNGTFHPDRDITRAEFASIVVNALGLMRPGTGREAFDDVTESAWYYDAVSIASEYSIIEGYGNGKFGPNDRITREQAMTMIAKAMKITALETNLSNEEAAMLLTTFVDSEKAAEWAREKIAICVKTRVVSGRTGKMLAPKDNITRAEAAVIVRNMLKEAKLI